MTPDEGRRTNGVTAQRARRSLGQEDVVPKTQERGGLAKAGIRDAARRRGERRPRPSLERNETMSAKSGRKVVVIGSGVGGAGIAALLAKRGWSVTVLERNAFPGGKAASFEKDGFTFDLGVHYTGRGEKGPLGRITRLVDGDLRFMKPDPFMRMTLHRTANVRVDISPLKERLRLAYIAGVPPHRVLDTYRLIRAMLNVKSEADVAHLDEVPLIDYVNRYTRDRSTHKLMTIFTWLLLAVPITEASAGEFLWCFANWFNDASCSYPKGGFKEIPGSYLRAMQTCGGTVRYNAPVDSIKVENGRASGVYVGDEFLEADVVVSNAGIVNTIRLAGESNFPSDYVRRSLAFTNSYTGVTVKYALDRKVFDIPIVFHGWGKEEMDLNRLPRDVKDDVISKHPLIFMPIPSVPDPDLAPAGKQLVIACAFAPSENEQHEYCRRLVDNLDKTVKALFPEIVPHILWEIKTTPENARAASGRATGDAIGLAQTYTQVGRNRPSPRMPIANLFLVGCDAGGRGIGTEMAADSALKVSEMIDPQ